MPEQANPPTPTRFDLIVLGAGPGGYVAAIKAAQLGLSVACVEKQYLGGTCLNVGCIPSKALLDSSERYASAGHDLASRGIGVGEMTLDMTKLMGFKNSVVNKMTGGIGYLFKKNKVTHLKGHGRLAGKGHVEVEDENGTKTKYDAANILVATGSVPNELPNLPFDGKYIVDSTGGLDFQEVPQKLLIVGGGYIGVEIGSVWNRLGSEVTVVEFADRILPASDAEMADALFKQLKKQGLAFNFNTVADSFEVQNGRVSVSVMPRSGGEAKSLVADKVMVAVGRKPVTADIGLETVDVSPNPRGFLEVDDHFRVGGAGSGVYAIGDVIGKIMLAHNAEQEGKAVVEYLAHDTPPYVHYAVCPAVVYTHPELASVGLTEDEAKAKHDVKVGRFPLSANGRATGMGDTVGFVKVIGDKKSDRLLGVHILAPHASDMIGECVMAMEFAASVEDVARTFHAHPTLPEAIKEAAMDADKHAIHI